MAQKTSVIVQGAPTTGVGVTRPLEVTVLRTVPTGPAGPPGVGLSAYDVAVIDGFVGTESEWLDSLKGAPGAPGSAPQAYHHTQVEPAASWLIPHNLGYRPAGIKALDSAGTEWVGTIEYVDDNNLWIHHTVAFAGTADLS